MTRVLLFALLTIGATSNIAAQDKFADQESPATKFEEFTSEDGALYITTFYEIESPKAKYGALEINVVRSINVDSGSSVAAMRFQFKDADKYASTRMSILDEDEVQSLSKAVLYIRKNQRRMIDEAKTYTEVTYESRSGFEAGFFISPENNSIGYYIRVGYETVFLDNLDGLSLSIEDAELQIKKSSKR